MGSDTIFRLFLSERLGKKGIYLYGQRIISFVNWLLDWFVVDSNYSLKKLIEMSLFLFH